MAAHPITCTAVVASSARWMGGDPKINRGVCTKAHLCKAGADAIHCWIASCVCAAIGQYEIEMHVIAAWRQRTSHIDVPHALLRASVWAEPTQTVQARVERVWHQQSSKRSNTDTPV